MMVKVGSGSVIGSKMIVIDHAQCGVANSTHFVLHVGGIFSYLKSVANGGQITSVNCLVFYSDPGLTTVLPFEREVHNLATGRIDYFIDIGTLSISVDTVIYMAWDVITIDRSTPVALWSGANAFRAYQLGDGTTLSGTDSAGNGNLSTIVGAIASAGKIGGAADFGANGAAVMGAYLEGPSAPALTYPFTMSAWAKNLPSTNADRVVQAVSKKSSAGTGWWWGFYSDGSTFGNVKIRAVAQLAGVSVYLTMGNWSPDDQYNLFHIVFVSATSQLLYENGTLLSVFGTAGGGSTPTGVTHTSMGGFFQNTSTPYGGFSGQADAARIWNFGYSASRCLAEFNNQSNPPGFYSVV